MPRCFIIRRYLLLSTFLSFIFVFIIKNVISYISTQKQLDHFHNQFISHQQFNKFNSNILIHNPIYPKEFFFSWPLSPPIEDILSSNPSIFSELYIRSLSIAKRPLIPMTITIGYVPVFFNWISHVILQNCTSTLDSLLVVAMDDATCEVMSHFTVVHVCFSETEFLRQLNLESNGAVENLFVTRLALFWLLSAWGFDILHFDVDAVPVNPNFIDLFLRQEADLVAGMGTFPSSAFKKLGATVCMGSFYLKSLTVSEGVCSLFTQMKYINSLDDQVKLNNALVNMGLRWNEKLENEVWQGCDKINQLKVVCFPQSMICRKGCTEYKHLRGTPEDMLHIMHPFIGGKTGSSKRIILERFHLWNFNSVAIDSIASHTPLDLVGFVKQNTLFPQK